MSIVSGSFCRIEMEKFKALLHMIYHGERLHALLVSLRVLSPSTSAHDVESAITNFAAKNYDKLSDR